MLPTPYDRNFTTTRYYNNVSNLESRLSILSANISTSSSDSQPFVFLQSASSVGIDTAFAPISLPGNVEADSLIVWGCWTYAQNGMSVSCTDNYGNPLNTKTYCPSEYDGQGCIAYSWTTNSGTGSYTISATTPTNVFYNQVVMEVRGPTQLNTSGSLVPVADQNPITVSADNVTSSNNAFVLSILNNATAGTIAASAESGYTVLSEQTDGNSNEQGEMVYKISTTAVKEYAEWHRTITNRGFIQIYVWT